MSQKNPLDPVNELTPDGKIRAEEKAKRTEASAVDRNYDDMTVEELEEFLGEERVSQIEGSGKGGNVLKKDLIKAAKGA